MHFTKNFRTDQDIILRFLDVLGGASAILMSSKLAGPGFFILAHSFIKEYIDGNFFRKEELLIKALDDNGFPTESGPIPALRTEWTKSHEAAEHLLNAARGWQAGDEEARAEISWATSEYTDTLRQHLDRLKNRIFPLLEQNISPEDEHRIAEGLNTIAFEDNTKGDEDKYSELIESLEDELRSWK